MQSKSTTDSSVKFFIVVIGLILIAAVLKALQGVVIPFFIAYLLYFLFAPLNNTLYDKKIPGALIILFDVFVILFISIGISRLLIESIMQFSSEWQTYANKLNDIVRNASAAIGIKDPFFRSFSLQKIIAKLDYRELAGSIFSSAFSLGGSALLTVFFFIFIVSGHHAVYIAFKKRFPAASQPAPQPAAADTSTEMTETKPSSFSDVEYTVNEITRQIQKYIVTKIAMNSAAGITVGLLMLLLDVDFALIWGISTFFLNFVPSIGSVLALIFPTLMALIQHGTIGSGLLTAGLIAIVQTLFFNILEPMLIGKRLGLNPIIILLSVLIWGYLWGVVGMLLAVPLTAIIKIIISNSSNPNLKFLVDLMDNE